MTPRAINAAKVHGYLLPAFVVFSALYLGAHVSVWAGRGLPLGPADVNGSHKTHELLRPDGAVPATVGESCAETESGLTTCRAADFEHAETNAGVFTDSQTEDRTKRTTYAECEANARLIAAAPDLLAACKLAHRALSELQGMAQEPTIERILLEAISKAEGKS